MLFAARPRTEIVTLNPRIDYNQHDVNMTIGLKADKAKAGCGGISHRNRIIRKQPRLVKNSPFALYNSPV